MGPQAEVDAGVRPGVTSEEAAEIKKLRREVAELRRHEKPGSRWAWMSPRSTPTALSRYRCRPSRSSTPAGVLRWIDVRANYGTRTEPADILAALDTL
jgi:hypothetical protein